MRQLILLAFLVLLPIQALPSTKLRILILDDCTTWEFKDYSQPDPDLKKSDYPFFSFRKIDLKTKDYISVSHIGVSLEEKMLSLDLTYPEILSHNPVYSSKLSLADWYSLEVSNPGTPIYLVIPSDYCSEKRFIWQQKFTVYLIHLILPYSE
jgi:hypothetical protein